MQEKLTTGAKPAVPAIARAGAVLDLIAAEPDALTLTDLADQTGLAKSSIHAITRTLVDEGLLCRTSRQTFVIGPHVMRWAAAFSARSDVAAEFARIWDEGAVRLQGATVTLSILDGDEVVYIGARNSENTPGFNFRIGMRLPLAYTATGQAFMSQMSDAEIRYRLRDGMPAPLTAHSPQSVNEILDLVAQTRARGYALDPGYVSEGMVCFGAPVLGASNKVVAGVAVSLPTSERSADGDQLVVRTLTLAARTISERLGAVLEGKTS